MNFDLKDELRNVFKLITDKNVTYKLLLCDENYPAYYIVDNAYKGVGIEVDEKLKDFKYFFENITITVNERYVEGGISKYFIQLVSNKINDTDEFFYICLKFIEPGIDGYNRKQILNNPQDWIDKWKILFGNRTGDDRIYPFIGELIALKDLLLKGQKAVLTDQGSHDIETLAANYEVKTTTMRYDSLIEIHSKNQLASLNGNPLYLYFVRLEKSISGVSINSLVRELENLNYEINDINSRLTGFNSELLDRCYKIDEVRLYSVNETFPKIVDSSFKEEKMPEGIYSLRYTVDLCDLDYERIETNK